MLVQHPRPSVEIAPSHQVLITVHHLVKHCLVQLIGYV
eukprot:COSAG01_NODE_43224_length_432_cov_0.513514_1_plen_37_part_10